MTRSAIAIEPAEAMELMSPYSRLRLGKTCNVECNVKVRDIGKVVREHKTLLLRYCQELRDSGWAADDDDNDDDEMPVVNPNSQAYGYQ
jgi:hypothetical protein